MPGMTVSFSAGFLRFLCFIAVCWLGIVKGFSKIFRSSSLSSSAKMAEQVTNDSLWNAGVVFYEVSSFFSQWSVGGVF